ncbi:MAG: nitroreductase family protein [Clostridia bacterium]|nr:nitroreductase family protein [Clostridia bacterium]
MMDLILSRHSFRGTYTPEKVPQEDLRAILEAGLAAPSGCNKQTTSLVAVDDPILLRKVLSVIDPPIAQTAPAAICVLTRRINAYRDRCYAVQDYSAAIENMLLMIHAMGYASCWYEGHLTDVDRIGDKIAKVLQVPEEYELVCLLPVGIPEEAPKAPRKQPFEVRAWFNDEVPCFDVSSLKQSCSKS